MLNVSDPIRIAPGLQPFTNARLRRASVRIDSPHSFANLFLTNGSILTHSPTTATTVKKLEIAVGATLQIDAASSIEVTGRGFLGGSQPGNPLGGGGAGIGMTLGFQPGSTVFSGGSYGGLGGAAGGGSVNPVYGDFRDPNEVGSGGGSNSGRLGGNGGGLVRIVAQTLQLDGVIRADGGNGRDDCCAAGGSGGGIRIDVGTLRGAGTISANGGNGISGSGGGGGGGRVAVYYQDATGFDFAKVNAFGGTGSDAPNGGAGTIFLQGP